MPLCKPIHPSNALHFIHKKVEFQQLFMKLKGNQAMATIRT
uniref:Uncharacterized protein n=1 Tax=Arundo donax TaxID=35708 RepID=A0A0A9CTL7_ARUDO